MNTDLKSFEQFMQQRADIASAYVNGNSAPLDDIVTNYLPATFFGPFGGFITGANEVASIYQQGAASFEPNSESHLEILQMAADNGIAFWVGFQRATVYLKGKPDPVIMNLRITEILRREGDDWKLVHRHADMLSEETSPEKK